MLRTLSHARGASTRGFFQGGALCRDSATHAPSEHPPRAGAEEASPLVAPASSSEDDAAAGASGGTGGRALLLAGVLVTGGGGALALSHYGFSAGDAVQQLEGLIASSGPLGPLVFIAAYVAATVLLFPASVLTLGAGYLFGPLQGTALVSVASTAGACAAFLVGRYLARPWAEGQLAGLPRFAAIDRGVAQQGAKIVLLLRLSPLVPFNLLNYALGLTSVGFLPYAAASWAGMLPGTFTYVYLGSVGKAAVDAAGGDASADGGLGAARVALYVVGAAATIWASKLIANAANKALEDGADDGGPGRRM